MTAPEGQGDQGATTGAANSDAGTKGEVEGYCVKCKAPRVMQNMELTKTKNGRNMAKGKCPVCGTTMTKFMKG